jgi:small GTP-binding protein
MTTEESIEFRKKICLLGDAAVGKTSLIKKFVFNEFDEKYITTIGTNVSKKDLNVVLPDEKNQIKNYELTMAIWDIVGQRDMHSFNLNYFRNANGGIVVCDITRRETLENLDLWTSSLVNTAGKVPIVLIINKYDLRSDAKFELEQLKHLADEFQAPCFYTSAKTGENVEAAFYALSESMVKGSILKAKEELQANSAKIASAIIMEFCNEVGGLERGIPIVREVFKLSGVNLKNPTKEQLVSAIPELEQMLTDLEGAEVAKRAVEKFNGLIMKLY